MDLSVVVASHANPQGLYLTVFSVLQQLLKVSFSWEIVISADGGTPVKWEKLQNVVCLRLGSHTGEGSPQRTRDAGIRAATSKNVLCVEDHVIVSDISTLLAEHIRLKGSITVPYRVGETGEFFTSYGYSVDWDRSFWNKTTQYSPLSRQPYPIAGFGHACFLVSKEFYIQSGGYFLEMRGWGGEEPDLTLLSWHCGQGSWMVPAVWHAHHLVPGAHMDATSSENLKRNFCIAAYEHGGDEYLQKTENYHNYHLQKNAAIEARRRFICQGRFGGDLNRLRQEVAN